MSDKLKKFINDHKAEFDGSEPSQDLWEKIDFRTEKETSHWIKSKWLKYFAFGASVITLCVFLIVQVLGIRKEKELAINKMEGTAKTTGNLPEMNAVTNNSNNEKKPETARTIPKMTAFASPEVKHDSRLSDSAVVKTDTAYIIAKSESSVKETEKTTNLSNEKKESNSAAKNKKGKLYIPEELAKINTYSGTLYDGSDLCEVIRAYKFPGKVSIHGREDLSGPGFNSIVKIISCSHLENMPNMKAVWLKGKTNKKVTLSVKKEFKNILLVKSDGRESSPEAISHYYAGRGVISEYTGKYFSLIFKDKVELILFFKDAEEGDKIVIDGIIEAVVKNKP
jgi:hypothetical protein